MKQKLKCFLGIFLSLALVLSLMPCMSMTVHADSAKAYAAYDVTTGANNTKSGDELEALQVTFNGKPWYIIEDNSTAVNAGTVTLLAADDSFGTSAFKSDVSSNSYNNSTVKEYLDSIVAGTAGDGKPNFAGVADAIKPVTLHYSTTVVAETTGDAKLYLLSATEASSLPENVRKTPSWWWLRSPGIMSHNAACVFNDGTVYEDFLTKKFDVRPALKLDLSAVHFSSASKEFTLNPYASLVNTTRPVKFNGIDWYIIEDNSTAVNAGTVTLLAADDSFGGCVFATNNSNSYKNSFVKDKYLESMVVGTEAPNFAGVADAIKPVTLTTYKYKSTDVFETTDNAMLYLLSVEDARSLPENVRKFNDFEWWLRSPGNGEGVAAYVNGGTGNVEVDGFGVSSLISVRPALQLDLSKVTFTSVTLSGGANATTSINVFK